MIDWTLDATEYLRAVVALACVAAIPYYLYSAFKLYRKDRTISVRGAGGKLFLAFLFFFIVKVEIMPTSGVQTYAHDGERAVFVMPNLFWKNEETDLELRFDPEIGSKLWMAKKNGKYYPFFVEPGGY